jgi:uncharacterized membrane protein
MIAVAMVVKGRISMNTSWRYEIVPLFLVVGMVVVAFALWPIAPETFPVHWNIRGEVDRYGGKFEGLLLLPLISVGLYALLFFLPRLDPGRANYPSFRPAFSIIRLAIITFLAIVYACTLFVAFGFNVNMGAVIPVLVGGLFAVLGNFMGKLRPNWFVGVRTPWTLSSRHSWNLTHRLAGRLFVLMGLAIGACGVWQSAWMVGIAVAINVLSVAWMLVYSYLAWRDDPERVTPAQISPSTDNPDFN